MSKESENKYVVFSIRLSQEENGKIDSVLEKFPTLTRNRVIRMLIDMLDDSDIEDYVLGKDAALVPN